MIKLFKTTPQFRVLIALLSGDYSFGELKKKTDLSGRWLSKTLGELSILGVVEKSGSHYRLVSARKIYEIMSKQLGELNNLVKFSLPMVDAREKAARAAEFLARNEEVLAIILFGSVAKGRVTAESDIDLLLITSSKIDLTDDVYDAMVLVQAPIEALTITIKQFFRNLIDEPTMLFGILEGYEVLYDRHNVVRGLLKLKEAEIMKHWVYDAEEEIWLERRLMPYSKQPETS
jgi:predicted nucleotidyltransferase